MATQRSLEGYSPWGCKELDMTEPTEHKWTYLWNRNRSEDIENKFMAAKGEGGRNKLGVWDEQIYTPTYKIKIWQGPTYIGRYIA